MLASSVANPAQAALSKIIAQTAWVAQYGQLVGQLQLRSAIPSQAQISLQGAEEPAMQAMLKLLPQLQQLQLEVIRPATVLKLLQSSSLTRLHLLEQPLDVGAAAAPSTAVAAAIKQLTSLRELAITGSSHLAGDGAAAVFSGLQHMTQLVLQPQLPAAALAQLPSQLVKLQLANPACDAAELVTHVAALPQLRSLGLMYGDPDLARQHGAGDASAWRSISSLRNLDLDFPPRGQPQGNCKLCHALAAAVADATALTRLAISAPDGVDDGVDVVAMLWPLQQLESLQLLAARPGSGLAPWPVETLRGLLSQQLTGLRSLTLSWGPLRQLVLSQICLQATQLTQLVLLHADMGSGRMEMLSRSMTQLRRLALCYCESLSVSACGTPLVSEAIGAVMGDPLEASVNGVPLRPDMPNMEQLVLIENGWNKDGVEGTMEMLALRRPAWSRKQTVDLEFIEDNRFLPRVFGGMGFGT